MVVFWADVKKIFHHWVQCQKLTLTSRKRPRVTSVKTAVASSNRTNEVLMTAMTWLRWRNKGLHLYGPRNHLGEKGPRQFKIFPKLCLRSTSRVTNFGSWHLPPGEGYAGKRRATQLCHWHLNVTSSVIGPGYHLSQSQPSISNSNSVSQVQISPGAAYTPTLPVGEQLQIVFHTGV